ncbi:hypothetical protein M8998_10550 [Sphingobacterium sp. lm-10]|uniref:hypothetical protein n=1 Tax=Sphingobacterium sp. lm-10 TaxID=2944904 RepID=UPI002022254A|nr:hypothetical protein [Sphingobacterium sp. lm-10]MCL7988378.1 hypothetical protein [Sphingobacterium sp. lm-10]
MARGIPFFIFCICLLFSSIAQAQKREIVQFSGVITATGTTIEVPYVTIINSSFGNQLFIANHEGYFTFVAHKGDVIAFTSIGYKPLTVTVPDVPGDKYSLNVEMESLVEELPIVTIGPPLPWASIEEFTMAFLGMNAGTDEYLNARRNLSPEALAALSMILPRSPEEMQSFDGRMNHVQMNNTGIRQNALTPFLNPFAWGQFINQIKSGDFSRKRLRY